MKERKLAVVMASMNPLKARDVTVELSRLRNIPEAGAALGQ
jgi:flagellar motility protein MotE (MotC chaperone)